MRIFDLKLTEQQLNVVATALGNLPYVQVAPTIDSINRQVAAQVRPAPPRAEEVTPTDATEGTSHA
jgi:hypothetical protein